MSDSLITMRKRYQTLFHGDSKFRFGLTWRGGFARILRFFIIALWLTESKLRISVTSESNLQAVESKPAPVSSNLHASFVTSTSTESKHRISVTSIIHASPSHPPPRNPSFAFWPLQPSIHVPRRSMRLPSHNLRVIHICCERWSRMRARPEKKNSISPRLKVVLAQMLLVSW